jgi:hypothetical protein
MNRTRKIEIKRIDARPARAGLDLTPYDETKVLLVNMIPKELSDDTGQDSEPFLAVHPDGQLMVGAAYTFTRDAASPKASPIYLSTDGGLTWTREHKIPATKVYNQSYCFSGSDRKLYGVIAGGSDKDWGNISVLETDDPTKKNPMRVISRLGSKKGESADQPFIQARRFDQDRIYVGQNYFGSELGSGKTASVRVSTNGGKTFRLLGLEARRTMGQDGPSVRPSIANDGTVYVAFFRWVKSSGDWGANTLKINGDVIVARDDEGAIGSRPFRALVDPHDGKPGRIVAEDRVIPFTYSKGLGQQRIGSSLSLAADPNDSATIYIAWADSDPATRMYTIHLRRSIDRGMNWSKDLLAIPSATNPAIAVSSDGSVGFLYQHLRDAGGAQERWETHFQRSANGSAAWTDILLSSFPTKREPPRVYQPYLGDKIHLLSIENNFYGVFSAPNIPDRKYFPQGVHFQRRHKNGKLLSLDGKARVPVSIDPYFFRIRFDSDSDTTQSVDTLLAEIRGPVLANYSGFVTAAFFNKAGRRVKALSPGETCELRVEFGPRRPKEAWADKIEISGGEDAPQVAFRVSVDAGHDQVTPETETVVVTPRGTSKATYRVVVSKEVSHHSFFIQIFQKTRLVQIIAPTLNVRKSSK